MLTDSTFFFVEGFPKCGTSSHTSSGNSISFAGGSVLGRAVDCQGRAGDRA